MLNCLYNPKRKHFSAVITCTCRQEIIAFTLCYCILNPPSLNPSLLWHFTRLEVPNQIKAVDHQSEKKFSFYFLGHLRICISFPLCVFHVHFMLLLRITAKIYIWLQKMTLFTFHVYHQNSISKWLPNAYHSSSVIFYLRLNNIHSTILWALCMSNLDLYFIYNSLWKVIPGFFFTSGTWVQILPQQHCNKTLFKCFIGSYSQAKVFLINTGSYMQPFMLL